MSEVKNMYLSFEGLQRYDELIKKFINEDSALAQTVLALDAKLGDFAGSDDKTVAAIIDEIYDSIAELVAKDAELAGKDAELEGKIAEEIAKIVGSLGEGESHLTLAEIAAQLKSLGDRVGANEGEIAGVKVRVAAVEEAIKNLGEIEGGESLGEIVSEVKSNTAELEALKGDSETVVASVNKIAKDAADAAQAAAEKHADDLNTAMDTRVAALEEIDHNHENKDVLDGISAEKVAAWDAAEQNAKDYVDDLVKDEDGAVKFDTVGSAAAAQAAAIADAAGKYQEKGNYETAGAAEAAKTSAIEAAAADATSKANAAQAAAEATAATLYQVKGNYETAGAAATAQAAAIEAAAADATEKADAAKDTAIEAAAADATEKADAAQAAAIEAAATDATTKADAAKADAIAEAKKYVDAISHAANVDYDEDTKKINLYDANGEKIGEGFDATPFIVDGMLENVNFVDDSDSDAVNTTLRFTFNTDSGKKEIDVDFSEYVDVYHADNSSIALDSATNTFSVKNVEATKTKTVGKIPVAGGPLAKLFENAGINVSDIAAGSSVEDIFMSLLCKELWPESIETKDATLTSSCANPTVTLNSKTSGSSDVEVGTSVAYSVSSGKSSYTATPHTASKLTYGYSAADDGSVDSTDTTKKASFGTIDAVSTSVPKLTLSGLVSETVEGTAGSAVAGAVSTSGNVVIEEGEKTLSAYGTSIAFTGTCSKLDKVYGCSNLGKTNNNGTVYTSTEKAEITKTSTAVNSGTISVKCVGKYKYFIGYSDKTTFDQFDSASVRALTTKSGYITVNGTTTPVGTTAIDSNGKSIIVAVPNKYKLSTIENGVGASILSNFSSVGEVPVATGTLNTTYTVYVYPITNGAVVAFKNVTITKA